MDILFVVSIATMLYLGLEMLWRRPGWLRVAPEEGPADETILDWGLFSRAFIRRRLAALAAELDRLDEDPDVFAKAFHTKVARAAYAELLADASRIEERPEWRVDQAVDVEPTGPPRALGEVLDL